MQPLLSRRVAHLQSFRDIATDKSGGAHIGNSCLFPLPGPLPEGEGNLFFVLGRWLQGIVADTGGGMRIGNFCIVIPAH